MIKIVHAADLFRRPILAASMFRDRAAQFHDRLGWGAVELDDLGLEFDEYDSLNPVYVIKEDAQGRHVASGRLLPTSGRTMIAEHFEDCMGGVSLSSPRIWEATRLCVSPEAAKQGRNALTAPAEVFWAGVDLAMKSGAEFFVAVFFRHMQRVWKAAGFAPEVVGSRITDEGEICGGIWELTDEFRDRLAQRAGLTPGAEPCFFPSRESFQFAREPLSSTLELATHAALETKSIRFC